jgi:hypothetical protein
MAKANRQRGTPLFVMLTVEEREQIESLAKTRGITLRELVLTSVLGGEPVNLHSKVVALETRLRALEARCCND